MALTVLASRKAGFAVAPPPAAPMEGWLRTPENTGLASAGVTMGMLSTYTGPMTVTSRLVRQNINIGGDQLVLDAGAVLEQCYITGNRMGGGQVVVAAAGVSIINCDIVGTSGGSAESIGIFSSTTDNLQMNSVRMTGFTITAWLDGESSTPASVIQECYFYGQPASSIAHHDGITRRYGNGALIIKNSRVVCDQDVTTGAFFIQDTWGGKLAGNVGNITVDSCLMEGQGNVFTLEFSNNLVITNNRVPAGQSPVTTYNGPVTNLTWANNYVLGGSAANGYKGALIEAPQEIFNVDHGFQILPTNTGHDNYFMPSLNRKITDADLIVHASVVSISDFAGDNAVFNGHWFQNGIVIDRNNATFNYCKFGADIVGSWAGNGYTFALNWCTRESTVAGNFGVGYGGYTAYRCRITGSSDGARAGVGPGSGWETLIRECYLRTNGQDASDHSDGVQNSGGAAAVTIERCNIDCRAVNGIGSANSAMQTAEGAVGLQTWTDNFLAGGGYVLRMYENATYDVQGNWILDGSWTFGAYNWNIIPITNISWGTTDLNSVVDASGAILSTIVLV